MKYRLIGIYQLVTGISGVVLLLLFAANSLYEKQTYILPSFALGIILFGGTAFAGYLLMKQQGKYKKYSLWTQALQIVSFTYKGSQYLFSASAFIALIFNKGIHIHTQLEPIAYNIAKVPDVSFFEIKIYLLPVAIILLLVRNKKH